MRRRIKAVSAVLMMMLSASAVGGCSDNGGESSPSESTKKATVDLKTVGQLGKILTDGKGRTLYLFEADKSTKSTCSGDCADAWPPLTTADQPDAGSGVDKSLLGTSTRSGGGKQVTYNGHPLYFYSGDKQSGDTNGQGLDQFGAKWYVLDSSGNRVTKKNGGGDGGGY